MPVPATYRVMTAPQRKLLRQVEDLARAVVRFARRSAAWLRESVEMSTRLDVLMAAHPEYALADVRQRVMHWLSLAALLGAVCLDAILGAPVAEHLLNSYAHVSLRTATIGRFVAPMFLIVTELGIGVALRMRARDRGWAAALPWAVVGLLPVAVMPILVGETERVAAAVREAHAAGVPVSQAGLFDGPIPVFTLAMMAFTLFIHAYVVYGPHDEAASYATWSVRTSALRAGKTRADERARRDANAAGDSFSQYVARRDEYVAIYPGWPLATPNWSEAPAVLERVFGYPVIFGPGSRPTVGAPGAAPPNAQPAGTAGASVDAASSAASSQPGEPSAPDLRTILEQRTREGDAAVSL